MPNGPALFQATFWLEAVFWSSLGATTFAYVGYPLVAWVAAHLFGRRRVPPPEAPFPVTSLLIAAHNEEDVIGEKLANAAAADYPRGSLEIVVGSDGSTDATNDIVAAHASAQVRLNAYRERRGKIRVLNDAVPGLRGDVVVFSDANTFFAPDAIRNLTRWFADPAVLAVCGRLVLTDPATGKNVDSLYWRYETFLKKCEARLGALLGANGAIYAMRRDRFVAAPPNTIVDDFVIPLLGKLRHGGEIVYDDDAVAYEETPSTISAEFRRRTRIGTGGYQSIALLWGLLNPARGWIAFSFLCHKILRWSVPFLLIVMFVANVALSGRAFFAAALACQLVFYAASLLGLHARGRTLPWRLLRVAGMFTTMNAALLVGFIRWMTAGTSGTWQRTSR